MPAIFAESLPGVDQRAADEPHDERDNRQLDCGGEPSSRSVGLDFGHVWLLQVTAHGVRLLQSILANGPAWCRMKMIQGAVAKGKKP
jgi:hypothetical protein